jgi:hypothetical protein
MSPSWTSTGTSIAGRRCTAGTTRVAYLAAGLAALSYRIARPLACRGIVPNLLTVWSVWLVFAVFVPASASGRWPVLAAWMLVLSGLADTIDGCVAVLTDRATQWGYVLDSGSTGSTT